jgi:hypothetical protein
MKTMRQLSSRYQLVLLLAGIVLAVFILGSALGGQATEFTKKDDQKEAPVVMEKKVEAVPSGQGIQVERQSYLIEELPVLETMVELINSLGDWMPSPARVFEVLFQTIVAPNAP